MAPESGLPAAFQLASWHGHVHVWLAGCWDPDSSSVGWKLAPEDRLSKTIDSAQQSACFPCPPATVDGSAQPQVHRLPTMGYGVSATARR